MTKSMKRIHKITIRRIPEYKDRHSDECIEINDKRAPYHCECNTFCIRASAEVSVTYDEINKSYLLQTIKSGGLYGIDADNSDGGYEDGYKDEIEQEQLSELREQLHAIGFSNRVISAGMRDRMREDE